MPYEKRVGERIEVGDLRVRWTHVHGRRKTETGRRKKRKDAQVDHEDAYMRNVSASGAGIVAPSDQSIGPGTAVEVEVAPGTKFVARVRRIVPTSDEGWWFYGVEVAEDTSAYRDWMKDLLDLRREGIITESHWRSAL